MFLIVRQCDKEISVLGCAESRQIAQAKMTECAKTLIMDKCGKDHLNIAFCESKKAIANLETAGIFLVSDEKTGVIQVYDKQHQVQAGYIITYVNTVVADMGVFRLLEAKNLTCREKTEGEYVCARCGHCETHYVRAPVNINKQTQSVFHNVMSELAKTAPVRN